MHSIISLVRHQPTSSEDPKNGWAVYVTTPVHPDIRSKTVLVAVAPSKRMAVPDFFRQVMVNLRNEVQTGVFIEDMTSTERFQFTHPSSGVSIVDAEPEGIQTFRKFAEMLA